MGMIDIILIKATWCKGDVRIIEWCPFAWLGFPAHIRLPRSGNEFVSRKKGEFSWYTIVWSSLEGHNSLPIVYKWSHRRGITFSLNILLPDFYFQRHLNRRWSKNQPYPPIFSRLSVFPFPKNSADLKKNDCLNTVFERTNFEPMCVVCLYNRHRYYISCLLVLCAENE